MMELRSHVRDRMKWGPTKPPYRVEEFNSMPSFYVSGVAYNLCVGIYFDRQMAERVAAICNKIAERYS